MGKGIDLHPASPSALLPLPVSHGPSCRKLGKLLGHEGGPERSGYSRWLVPLTETLHEGSE